MSAPADTASCCIVGGGPAGLVLTLLLARAGVDVTLLEAHRDFDRDFRGDMVHPSTLEVLDQIGLADSLLQLPHRKAPALELLTPAGVQTIVSFQRLRSRFPYLVLMPQVRFLEFVASHATCYPHVRLVTGATVNRLIHDDGQIVGVACSERGTTREIRATLTIAADGRFSRLRQLAGMEAISQSPPMDVLWVRIPRTPSDPCDEVSILVDRGRVTVVIGRDREWQIGVVAAGGTYQALKQQGLHAFRTAVAERLPWATERMSIVDDWRRVAVLTVAADRLREWYRPGLLFIGDAAHAMLPVAGAGINCAVADAVAAANVLSGPLRRARVTTADLARVQRSRERPTRMVQRFQRLAQRNIIEHGLTSSRPFGLPIGLRLVRRIPLLRDLPGRLLGLGIPRVRLVDPREIPINAASIDGRWR